MLNQVPYGPTTDREKYQALIAVRYKPSGQSRTLWDLYIWPTAKTAPILTAIVNMSIPLAVGKHLKKVRKDIIVNGDFMVMIKCRIHIITNMD